MERILIFELLDDNLGTAEKLQQGLRDLWRNNRSSGGIHSNLNLLEKVFERTPSSRLRILDVGTGDGRLEKCLELALSRRKQKARFEALDRQPRHLRSSHPDGERRPRVAADAFGLPFPENSFNVVICNQFSHHFSAEDAQISLQLLSSVAIRAVAINNLERSLLPHLSIRVAYPLVRSRITDHDGPAGVRQAYTSSELAWLVAWAGLLDFTVEGSGPFRLGLTRWKSSPGYVID